MALKLSVAVLFSRDKALVRRLLAGDEESFSEFFSHYVPRLYRFALVRLNSEADGAEEIVQMTLLKVIPKLQTYRGEAPLFTWLCTFCRREISRYFKSSKRLAQRETLVEDVEELRNTLEQATSESSEDPERILLRREIASLVQTTLDRLPGHYGDVLEWKYVEGLSVKEIAERLATGQVAVQSMLARARQAFREDFGPLPPSVATLQLALKRP